MHDLEDPRSVAALRLRRCAGLAGAGFASFNAIVFPASQPSTGDGSPQSTQRVRPSVATVASAIEKLPAVEPVPAVGVSPRGRGPGDRRRDVGHLEAEIVRNGDAVGFPDVDARCREGRGPMRERHVRKARRLTAAARAPSASDPGGHRSVRPPWQAPPYVRPVDSPTFRLADQTVAVACAKAGGGEEPELDGQQREERRAKGVASARTVQAAGTP